MVKEGYAKRNEGAKWATTTRLEQYTVDQWNELEGELGRAPTSDELAARFTPVNVIEDGSSNLLTSAGANRLASLATGSGQAMDATHTLLGVGDSATAATTSDTGLGAPAGASHQYWYVPDSTYPSVSGGTITVKATFASGDGNFHWQEWALYITNSAAANTAAPGAGVLLNHKIADMGTKSSAGVWAFSVTATIA